MKKIFSLLLVVCMLLSSCIVFSSCAKVSQKDAEKDPQAVLSDAFGNTGSTFFEDENSKQLLEIIAKALENGSLSLVVESDMLKDQIGLGKITETLYMNSKDQRVVSDTVVNYNNEDLSARIFLDKNGLMLNSESVLGNTNTYALYPANIAEKFPNSIIASMIGLDASAMPEELSAILNSVKDTWESAFANIDSEKADENANALLATLKQTVETDKYENAEGKNVKCVQISYEITNQTLKDFVNKALELANVTDQSMKDAASEVLEELEALGDMEGYLKIRINQKTNSVEKIFLGITFKDKYNGSTLNNIYAEIIFGENEIALNTRAMEGTYNFETSMKLTKTVADDAVTYALTVTESDTEGHSATPLTGSFVQKKNGEFTLSAVATEDEDEKTEFELKGKLTVNKEDATIAINSFKSGDITVEFNVSLTFKTEAEMPAAPTDAKDVMDLTEADIESIMSDFQNSKLGKLIFGAVSAY